jgi:hypothetical protein
MLFSKISVHAMSAFALVANGAILEMYSDRNCQNSVGSRNVWDNSCATGVPGFQSYIITWPGGDNQAITTYSRAACAGPQTTCNWAGSTGVCYPSFNSAGGSNAIGSGIACGFV